MKNIKTKQGHIVLLDNEDYEKLSGYTWYSMRQRKSDKFYVTRSENKKTIYIHREILNPPKDMVIDHIDNDGLNNQKSNLRIATRSQNQFNRIKDSDPTSSKYKGVFKEVHKRNDGTTYFYWSAQVYFLDNETKISKRVYYKKFMNEIDAAKAYNEKALEYYGDFAKLNIINSATSSEE